MHLVVDTSVLVGELLRAKGRRRLEDDRRDLYLPEQMQIETGLFASGYRSGPLSGCPGCHRDNALDPNTMRYASGMVQVARVNQLLQARKAKGNPPCDHPETDKEYYLGSATGDDACLTCAKTWPRRSGRPHK